MRSIASQVLPILPFATLVAHQAQGVAYYVHAQQTVSDIALAKNVVHQLRLWWAEVFDDLFVMDLHSKQIQGNDIGNAPNGNIVIFDVFDASA